MATTDEKNQRLAQNSIILSLRMVFTLFLSLYTTRVVLKHLGVDDFGLYNVVCGFVSMFSFFSSSLANGVQRYYNFELSVHGVEGAKKVYNSALIIQFIVIVLLVLLCEIFGLWFMYHKMVIAPERFGVAVSIFHMSIVSFVFVILQVPFMAAIMAHEKMNFYALVTILSAVVKLLIAVSLSFTTFDRLYVYSFLMMLVPVLECVLYLVYAKVHFKSEVQLQLRYHKELLKSMLTFSGWNIFGQLGDMLREQGVNVLLNLFFGVAVNAARGVAFQVIGGLRGLVSNLGIALRPQIVQSYAEKDYKRTMNLMYSLSKLSFLFLYVISLPVIVEIDYILMLWLGDNIPEYTAVFVRLVIIVNLVGVLNAAVSAVVHATGQMKLYQTTGTFSVIMVLPVSYIWVKLGGGPEAPFIVGVIFAIIMQIVALWVLKQLIPFSIRDYNVRVIYPIFKVCLLSSVPPLLIYYVMDAGFYRLAITLVVSVSIGSLIAYFMGMSSHERQIINAFIQKITGIKIGDTASDDNHKS